MIQLVEGDHLNNKLSWYNEPENWQVKNGMLHLTPEAETDFWQKTHYGFSADNGHFLYAWIKGDFVMETRVEYHFKNQYDQAGLMVSFGPECWIKTSIEFEPDHPNNLGAVVTNHGFSDWSTQQVPDSMQTISLRVSRKGTDFLVHFKEVVSGEWIQLRMAHLHHKAEAVQCGVYACSPKGPGFLAVFQKLDIEEG